MSAPVSALPESGHGWTIYEYTPSAWKKQVVDLQAQLLAAQDQIIEQQRRLLEFRQIANAPTA
jgi:hypothetical protein